MTTRVRQPASSSSSPKSVSRSKSRGAWIDLAGRSHGRRSCEPSQEEELAGAPSPSDGRSHTRDGHPASTSGAFTGDDEGPLDGTVGRSSGKAELELWLHQSH